MRAPPLVIAAVVAALAGPAAAETPEELIAIFAHTEASKVTAAAGVRLDRVRGYTHLLVGTYRENEFDHHVVVLMKCGRRCTGRSVWLGNSPFELHGLVDLAGAPAELPGKRLAVRGAWIMSLSGKGMKFPALIVTTRDDKQTVGGSRFRGEVKGTESHHKLLVISLRASEEPLPKIADLSLIDRYPSGAGTFTTYELVSGKQRGALDLHALEQWRPEDDSMCLPPKPVEHLYRFLDGRYQQSDHLLSITGCGH